MRRKRLLMIILASSLAAGCGTVDDWTGLKRGKEPPPAPVIDDGQIIAEYLGTLDRLGRGGTAVQAEILETTRAAYLVDPSTRNRLTYSFVLAVPGHAGTDSDGARRLLGEDWLPAFVAKANAGGIERVLL